MSKAKRAPTTAAGSRQRDLPRDRYASLTEVKTWIATGDCRDDDAFDAERETFQQNMERRSSLLRHANSKNSGSPADDAKFRLEREEARRKKIEYRRYRLIDSIMWSLAKPFRRYSRTRMVIRQ